MIRIVVATGNAGKLAEFAHALAPVGIEVAGLESLADDSAVDETGSTFEENARLKAAAYSRRTERPVLADDSGLEVDALGGEPGVQSARYGGAGLDDARRCALVLERLAGVASERRTARFRCVLAIALGGRVLGVFDGAVEGRIAEAPRGAGGFGYDPIFFHPGSGRTFAELERREKERVSHRGLAIRAFVAAVRSGTLRLDPSE